MSGQSVLETRSYRFHQVDVFAQEPLKGNPLAVVVDADDLTDAQMAGFANWTNLSETTFLCKPTVAGADYRVRIFTPNAELPFAGHPTLGSCAVWLATSERDVGDTIIQQCGVGLVKLRREAETISFAAPPLRKSGPVEPDLLERLTRGLGIGLDEIVDANWVDNGPDWIALLLKNREAVLAIKPDYAVLAGQRLGVVAPWHGEGRQADFELRAFTSGGYEDPVTGSFNAGVAQWLIGANIAPASYIASQGTVLGRAGRIHVEKIGADVWIGGHVTHCIEGELRL